MLAADLPPAIVQTEQLAIELVSADQRFVAGGQHWLGLRLRHAPHWHTYWRNPGDSGLPTRTRWTLPAGVSVGELQWPAPARHPLGELSNFGYDGEQVLPIAIKLDPGVDLGHPLRLQVEVSWLVCEEACIPGKATLSIERPLDAAASQPERSADADAVDAALAQVPLSRDWPLSLRSDEAGYTLELQTDAELGAAPELFPVQPQVLSNSAPAFSRDGNRYRWQIARSDYFVGMPEPFEVVLKDPGSSSTSSRSYVLVARSSTTASP